MPVIHALRSVLPGLLLALALTGCAGDLPPNTKPDSSPWPYPEASSWPEASPQQQDQWPTKLDTYQGAPFGCQGDEECFGLRCCATPWGVRLCADRCP